MSFLMQCHDNFPRINVPDFKLLSNGPLSDLRMLRNQGTVFQRTVLEFPSYLMIRRHYKNTKSARAPHIQHGSFNLLFFKYSELPSKHADRSKRVWREDFFHLLHEKWEYGGNFSRYFFQKKAKRACLFIRELRVCDFPIFGMCDVCL